MPEHTPLYPCPHCGRWSLYDAWGDRYYHHEGHDNRGCWLAINRGEKPLRPQTDNKES